jgi:hypothetical protein
MCRIEFDAGPSRSAAAIADAVASADKTPLAKPPTLKVT